MTTHPDFDLRRAIAQVFDVLTGNDTVTLDLDGAEPAVVERVLEALHREARRRGVAVGLDELEGGSRWRLSLRRP